MFSETAKELLKAARPDYERVKALLASGADFNEIDPEDSESVFTAYLYGYRDPIYDFLKLGARPTVPEQQGGHSLIFAVWSLDYGLLRELLQSGADPNQLGYTQPDDSPMTALDAVADGYHTEDDPHAHVVLNAMDALIKQFGGRYACDRSA